MMRGYWNAAQINSEAFFERPAAGGCSDRVYRSGDLVLEREDGNMMVLGRKDRQIKVRGYRVELDEIESVLSAHACVEEAAVYSLPGSADAQSIEAAVIPVDAPAEIEKQLRRHCAQYLPNYALPETLRLMTSFPRTTSGKIDRRSLRAGALQQHGAKD